MLMADSVEQIRILGYTLGNFATPGGALVSALVLGWVMGAIPTGAAELLVLAIASVRPQALVLPLVLVMTAGHVAGKLVWYWAATQQHRVRQPWLRRHLDLADNFLHRHPTFGVSALVSSAVVSLPPYHLAVIGAGLVRMPLWLFLSASFAGRATRFVVIASIPRVADVLFG